MTNTDSESKTKNDVYRERNLLAIAFVQQFRGTGFDFGWWPDTDSVNGDSWAVVWADTQNGQVGWHVDMSLIPDWLPKRDPEYDGYSTDAKNRRLAEYANIPVRADETDRPDDGFDYGERRDDGQFERHPTTDEGEFVQPVRETYVHADGCGSETTMKAELAESFARDPGQYGKTFCASCGGYYPLDEFRWENTSQSLDEVG